ncbi:MAG: AraC family transcriptional regulator [Victivallales bacterium]|nr:AraC family transcriptional regulator [Victivallales bacterium]
MAVQNFPVGSVSAGIDVFEYPALTKLVWVCDGGAVYCCAGRETRLESGDVVVIYPGCGTYFKSCKNFACYCIYYDPPKIPLFLALGELPFARYLFPEKECDFSDCATPQMHIPKLDFGLLENLTLRLRYECRRRRIGHEAIVIAIFTEILVYVSRSYSLEEYITQSHRRLKNITVYIRDHYFEKLTASRLTKVAGMSERNFYRYFREAYGISPNEYIIGVRLQHSIEYLHLGELSIAEIAATCGFSDSNHFCKLFKRAFGKSPSAYRKAFSHGNLPDDIPLDRV